MGLIDDLFKDVVKKEESPAAEPKGGSQDDAADKVHEGDAEDKEGKGAGEEDKGAEKPLPSLFGYGKEFADYCESLKNGGF